MDSAIHQTTHEPYEILLIDDGSTDRTPEILDEYAEKYEHIRVIHQENQGIGKTRRRAAKEARGAYIFWIDADDYADERLLDKTLPLLIDGADIVVYGIESFDSAGNIKSKVILNSDKKSYELKNDALKGTIGSVWMYGSTGCYWEDERIPFQVERSGEDGYMTIRIFEKAKVIKALSDVLYYYRDDSAGATRHSFSSASYMGTAFLWFYRMKLSEEYFPENVRGCAKRAMSAFVRVYAIDSVTHELTNERKKYIIDSLKELNGYSIRGRWRDKFLSWTILHGYSTFCYWHGMHRYKKWKRKLKAQF